MKKIFAAFFIILILGGTVFFFGWVQFRVPPGSWGVMRSRTHGIDMAVIGGGEFRWLWYAAIPANVEITLFKLKPVEQPIRVSGSLPSGDVFAAFAGTEADFSYEYSGFLSFMLRATYLPVLMTEHGVASQEDLAAFERRLSAEISAWAVRRLEEYAGEDGASPERDTDKLKEDILREYPYIENLSCALTAVRRPDITLYDSLRKIYADYIMGLYAQGTETSSLANRQASARIRFDELAKYGELLTKYPILLQYLALEMGEGEKTSATEGDL
ncbi:MAG: hypothetical protein LBU18_06150 [Treponema sp.]|nr:hypothetical protein [Treponema sp.]